MKNNIRLLALILSLLALSSCGSGSNTPTVTDAQGDTTQDETTEERISDNLPEKNYGGYEFTMFIRDDDVLASDMYVDEADGDIMNDAIYARNSRISERFGVNFTVFRRAGDVDGGFAKNTILAGEDAYDIVVCHARTISSFAHNDYLLEWNTELPYIDLDKPWWNQDARENLSVAGKLYTCAGDISYQNLGAADAMLFNKQLFEDMKINDIYDTVRSGKWTFDLFSKYVLDGSADLDGDQQINIAADRLGYVTSQWVGPIQVLYSGGQRICTKDENDELVLSLNTERTVEIFDKFFALADSGSVNIVIDGNNSVNTKAFVENRALFLDQNIKYLNNLRDMQADFGIIPWPKFDETYDKYYSNVDAGCNMIGVPKTATDPERTSIILEALCADGHYNVIPTYYEVALQTKYTRDDDSVQMLDLIRDGRVFDAGYFYSNNDFSYEINSIGRFLANEADHNFSSFYAKYEKTAKELLVKINEIYRNR